MGECSFIPAEVFVWPPPGWKACAWAKCGRWFEPRKGGSEQVYCSKNHRDANYRASSLKSMAKYRGTPQGKAATAKRNAKYRASPEGKAIFAAHSRERCRRLNLAKIQSIVPDLKELTREQEHCETQDHRPEPAVRRKDGR